MILFVLFYFTNYLITKVK